MRTVIKPEYRVSERVVLQPGDRFRVGGGPYYRTADGTRIPMAVRGVVTLRQVIRTGRGGQRVLLEVQCGEGTAILHVAGSRRSPVEGMVARPYKIRGKVRAKKIPRKTG